MLDQILAKFKFKKFKLERKGKHIRLYGEVNPWVLLADGTIEEVDEQKLKQLELDGKKPITLSDAELEKLNKLDKDQREIISKSADGDKSRIDFDSITETGNDDIVEIIIKYETNVAYGGKVYDMNMKDFD
ncbi:hypothetical protein [Paenibacillus sp. BAC0078]